MELRSPAANVQRCQGQCLRTGASAAAGAIVGALAAPGGHFRGVLALSESELDRLVAFVRDEPVKARIRRYAMAPESPQATKLHPQGR